MAFMAASLTVTKVSPGGAERAFWEPPQAYLENGYSNTVTVIRIPEGMTAADILETMKKDHNIMIAGSFDVLTGQVIRIGHMGENANEQDVTETLQALEQTLSSLKKK